MSKNSKAKKINWNERIEEAKTMPFGSELWVGHKYNLILLCREKLDSLKFWRIKEKMFYKILLKRLAK